jgi:flagellar export protein FliJ
MELGRLQVQISQHKNRIEENQKSVQTSYDSHEVAMGEGITGQEVRFHPYFVAGKMAAIKQHQEEIHRLESIVEERTQELAQLRAKVKVLDKMKEKEKDIYKKELEKKQYQDIEEQVQNWKQYLK